jgi:putative pyruvate formate lyase activating enzyme
LTPVKPPGRAPRSLALTMLAVTPEAARADSPFVPVYLRLLASGELARRVETAYRHLEDCDLCARYCRVSRRAGAAGAVCRTGSRAVVASYGPHHGEEDVLRGAHGSGTIFFSGCNLRCVYCQNWEISQKRIGREVEPAQIADMMLELQGDGCHNINFVSPSHVVAQVIAAVEIAARCGLRLPLVYNTGGYDSLEALRLLDGIVDIYMPDMKYGDARLARRYSKVRDYVAANREAVKQMHRQVGDLLVDERGIAQSGLLVRHLVLPGNVAGTDAVLAFLAEEVSPNTYVNLMDQYRPCYRADAYPELDQPVTRAEYEAALACAARCGIARLDDRAPRRRPLRACNGLS